MTTDIMITSTMDVSEQNDVFNIGKANVPANCTLAGISWLRSSERIDESRLVVLRSILSLIIERLAKFNIWLFVGNSAWQPDTRIVRHRKLWKALKSRGVEISHSGDFFEEMIESDQGLKFFGAKLISELSAESVIQTIAEERCAYILVLPKNVALKKMLSEGWRADSSFDEGILRFVADNNSLVLKAVGEFDDVEAGFVGIAKPELVKCVVV